MDDTSGRVSSPQISSPQTLQLAKESGKHRCRTFDAGRRGQSTQDLAHRHPTLLSPKIKLGAVGRVLWLLSRSDDGKQNLKSINFGIY